MRIDGRDFSELRPISIITGVNKHAEGSALIKWGDTHVLCTATVEEKIPQFMKGQGRGWVTAEYSMLPRATGVRNARESAKGKIGGRTYEIQRLIGRALRSVVNLERLGERTIWLDCDVLQADGGTRTAAVTGAFVAMLLAMKWLVQQERIPAIPVSDYLAAISVGLVDGTPMADLRYEEDSRASVDMNVVVTGRGKYVELQGTGEEHPFSPDELASMLKLAGEGAQLLFAAQRAVLNDMELGGGGLEADPSSCSHL